MMVGLGCEVHCTGEEQQFEVPVEVAIEVEVAGEVAVAGAGAGRARRVGQWRSRLLAVLQRVLVVTSE